MTIAELIAELAKHDEAARVVIWDEELRIWRDPEVSKARVGVIDEKPTADYGAPRVDAVSL